MYNIYNIITDPFLLITDDMYIITDPFLLITDDMYIITDPFLLITDDMLISANNMCISTCATENCFLLESLVFDY
jgi:hypothetical protein